MKHFRNGFEGHLKAFIESLTTEAVLFFFEVELSTEIIIQRRQRICFYYFSYVLFSFCLQLTATKIVRS